MQVQEQIDTARQASRRSFLRTTGAVAGTTTLVSAESVVHELRAAATAPHYALLVDLRRCFGCHGCAVACKAEYKAPLRSWNSWVNTLEAGPAAGISRSFLPVLCNQCDNPACVRACPVRPKATYKDRDGVVQLTDQRCIGCARCARACPYKVRWMLPVPPNPGLDRFKDQVVRKCTLCQHRIRQGLVPACVNTCNARARIFGDLNDPNSEISRLIATNDTKVLLPEKGTKPNVFYLGLPTDLEYQPHNGGDYAGA